MEIHPNITGVDVSGMGGIWLYLVRGQKTAIIDTGPKQPFPLALEQFPDMISPPVLQFLPSVLEKMGMTLADIDLILNSHIHFDHTAGNAAIKSASGAEILIHADEAKYFENPELLFGHELVPIIELVLGGEHLDEQKKSYLEEETGPGPYVAVDKTFKDNDVIELGNGCDLKVVHLPGHTQGSVGFYLEEEGILIAGDAMQGVCGHAGGLPILDDPAAFESSLERVQEMPLKVMIHAHPFRGLTTPHATILQGAEIGQFLKECLEFSRMVREAARSVAPYVSRKPFLELYDDAIGKLPAELGLNKINDMPRQFFSPATLLHYVRQVQD